FDGDPPAMMGFLKNKDGIRPHIREFNGVSIALVAGSGVVSKSTDRIFASYGAENPEISDEVFQANHYVQYKENLENSSNSNQEKEGPPQDFDIRKLIREECCAEASEEQKQNMEDTMLELVKIRHQKELLCIHDNVDDLIESALNSKILSINSQRLEKEQQEVNVIEQPAERGNHSIESLQNFRVIHKSSISLNKSQISSVHTITSILSTKEPEYSSSMGYEHLNITPETESDEVTESNAENLLPIPSECEAKSSIEELEYSFSMGYEHFSTTLVTELDEVAESSIKNLVPIPHEYEVTSDNKSESNEPVKNDSSVFTTFSNPFFNDSDDFTSNDENVPIEESKVHSNPLFDNDEINSDELESHVESNFVESLSNHDALIDSSQKIDHLEEFSGPLMHIRITEEERIRREHVEYISLIERLITINPYPRPTVNANTIVDSLSSSLIPVQDNDSQREEILLPTRMNYYL
nr:hypothetical protein [Tanacetum cinerariifolium]